MNQADVKKLCQDSGADYQESLRILEKINRGECVQTFQRLEGFPSVDNKTIIDFRNPEAVFGKAKYQELYDAGLGLLPYTAVGVLNGGMATSYVDHKKNEAFHPKLFEFYQKDFERLSPYFAGKPKGITPAFIQPNGKPGPSFMELKMRSALILSLRGQGQGLPLFQMSSTGTNQALTEAYDLYRASPYLQPLADRLRRDITQVQTGVQGLISAFTHSKNGTPRDFYINQENGTPSMLALPGGHGQNFSVLAGVYQKLLAQGYRYAYIGNVDNLGFLPDPLALGLLEHTGADAGFDFSFKTPLDTKGGILYFNEDQKIQCGDIGVSLDPQSVNVSGQQEILFNCATGLFRLDYLVKNLERIKTQLPLRLSDQDKDTGRYSQAEQVTWEVIGLIDRPQIFAVEKNRRFLAAKLLMDCFLTSGLRFYELKRNPELADILPLGETLHGGLTHLLVNEYGFRYDAATQEWVPLSPEEL